MNNQSQQKGQSQGTTSQTSQLNEDIARAQMKPVHQGHSIEDQAQQGIQAENKGKVHHHSKPKTWDENTEPLIVTKGEEIKGNLQQGEISNANRTEKQKNLAQKGSGDQYYELLEEDFVITSTKPAQSRDQNIDQINLEKRPRNDYNIESKPGENPSRMIEEAPGIGQAFTESAKITYESVKEDLASVKQKLEQTEIVQTVEQKLSDAGQVITTKLGELGQAASQTYGKTKEELPKMYESVKETAKGVGKNISEKIHEAKESETAHMIEEKVSNLAQGAKEIIVTAGEKINEAFQNVSETITEALLPSEDLTEKFGQEGEFDEEIAEGRDQFGQSQKKRATNQYPTGQKDDLVKEYKDAIQELKAHHYVDINTEDVKLANTENIRSRQNIKPKKNLASNELFEEYTEVIQQLGEERHHRINRGEVKIANTPSNLNQVTQNQNQFQPTDSNVQDLTENYKDALQELQAHHHPKINVGDIKLASTSDNSNNQQQQFSQNQQQNQQFKQGQGQNQGQNQQNQDLTGEYKDAIEELEKHCHPNIKLDDVKLANANQTDVSKSK